jgi:hypothetical protein
LCSINQSYNNESNKTYNIYYIYTFALSVLLKKIKRTLKEQNEEKLRVVSDWGHFRSDITSM